MMRPIEPFELSAFIDGELDAERTAEVRAALATDEALRAQHEALLHADAQLSSLAAGMTLIPHIRLPPPKALPAARARGGLWQALPALVIPAAWLIARLSATDWLAVAASVLAFLVLLNWVVRLVADPGEGPASGSHPSYRAET